MRCPHCETDLGTQETITSIYGVLKCLKCATKLHTEQDLLDYAEDVVPSDIFLLPECDTCHSELPATSLIKIPGAKICQDCVNKLRTQGGQ